MDERPKLRYVDAHPVDVDGKKMVYLRDPEGLTDEGMAVPYHVYFLLTMLDGQHSVLDLQEAFCRKFNGTLIPSDQIQQLLRKLDDAYLLDTERYQELRRTVEADFRAASVRPASHAGASYPEDPEELKGLIDGFFRDPEGPGPPESGNGKSRPCGLMAPHIDFKRGGPCFAWAYRALADAPAADLFVILGTGHSARRPYVLSPKDFETPLGTLRADRAFVDRLAGCIAGDPFEDEMAHRAEHSIEFQTVFLKYLYPDRDITFVPILCGSYQEVVDEKRSPTTSPAVSAFVDGLRRAIQECDRQVCVIAGVDLSHVGGRFGDSQPLTEGFLSLVERLDRELLEAAEAVDAERFYDIIAREDDRSRVCGTSSIYTMLQVLPSERGELLKYDRTIDGDTQSMVSFASMAFYPA